MGTVKKLINTLKKQGLTLACAESASGGYLSYLLTQVPGSSTVFKGGLVVYSLEAKRKFLGLHPSILKKTNGVSAKVAGLLAGSIRKKLNTSLAISIVGYAGPDAATGFRPGTFFIGLANKKGTLVKKIALTGGRDAVRKKACWVALKLITNKLSV